MNVSRKTFAWLTLALAALYAIWIGGPYLRSIVVRDGAVTTWLQVVASPIPGQIGTDSLAPGDTVGSDGRILTVENPRFDASGLARARAELDAARAREASAARILRDLEAVVARRARITAEYTQAFKNNLDTRIGGMREYVALLQRQLELARIDETRATTLVPGGVQTQAAADAAAARVAEIQVSIVDMQTGLDRSLLHRKAADDGMLMLDDASDGAAMQRSLDDARMRLEAARGNLAVARMEAEAAARVVAEAETHAARTRTAVVTGRPGALVWSRTGAPGAAVQAGTPVASWIDCRVLLVDAAVSDVYIPLLRPGAPATVVIEGERDARQGQVVLMRGGAAAIGADDLAAVAKGREPGVGQVLVGIEPTDADRAACPVGRAAFIHFPDVNVFDVARARLRW